MDWSNNDLLLDEDREKDPSLEGFEKGGKHRRGAYVRPKILKLLYDCTHCQDKKSRRIVMWG